MNTVANDPSRKPINRDAVNILRRIPEEECSERDIIWKGLISKCPKCGGRAYENGWCFGCGRRLAVGAGLRKRRKRKHEIVENEEEDWI